MRGLRLGLVLAFVASGCTSEAEIDTVSVEDLRAAAELALQHRAGDTIDYVVPDSLRAMGGRLFSPDRQHLYVQLDTRRPEGSQEVAIAVFSLQGWKTARDPEFVEVVLPYFLFVGDTLRDANGDGFRDYVLRTYSSSGCCRRNDDLVRLYNRASGAFGESFRLLNPTYYPEERLVRGVEYGHPGWVPLYTSRFTHLGEPKEVECIYRLRETPERFVRGACRQTGERPEGDTLNALPKVYESVEELSWFLAEP